MAGKSRYADEVAARFKGSKGGDDAKDGDADPPADESPAEDAGDDLATKGKALKRALASGDGAAIAEAVLAICE